MAKVQIGCSGFNYNHWRGTFYPEKLPQRLWFAHYFSVFSTVELNVTFYRLPQLSVFQHWREQTPENFQFVIKGSRFITHIKKLKEVEEPLQRFFDAASGLGDKLRVVLWQLAPSFFLDLERLSRFLELLDRYPVRNAFEFRNESWFCEQGVELCRGHNAAICLADWPQYLYEWAPTADFIYLRRHGHGGDYAACYSEEELSRDAERIRSYLKDGRDVYIYYNNDALGFAPQNALRLAELLQLR
ncbi:protein of unknown function DUF72 [Geotalea daltonii FRC-32]|uniref:DUF72 domain-containing protein n=1 Tax=Geotalea daltonii (strain DSM 22248 / JCM 15807 / FRC-32) TaxID=316067 RepID=B9M4G1_GEODF|nr:DUF72 domain-containing protein [Geotalea daltonii]ACM19687.1 protein of unknown function DUF72 [Geotalea daltonii FRC-32]